MTNTFEDLVAWQKARLFIKHTYQTTSSFPTTEQFGLTSQFRRAAISIAANIAEGYKRLGKDDKLRFFNYSQGSLEECRCYIILSNDLGYITENEASSLLQEIEDTSRLLNSYCSAITTRKEWGD
jgi:four helix bundle protein